MSKSLLRQNMDHDTTRLDDFEAEDAMRSLVVLSRIGEGGMGVEGNVLQIFQRQGT
jgi:hypothetical protein